MKLSKTQRRVLELIGAGDVVAVRELWPSKRPRFRAETEYEYLRLPTIVSLVRAKLVQVKWDYPLASNGVVSLTKTGECLVEE